jgi:hypothetical protein
MLQANARILQTKKQVVLQPQKKKKKKKKTCTTRQKQHKLKKRITKANEIDSMLVSPNKNKETQK